MGQLFTKKKEEICPHCRFKRQSEKEFPRKVKRARANEQEDGEVNEVDGRVDFSMREVEAANIEVAENFRTTFPTAVDDNWDRIHEALDDNSRVVLEVKSGESPGFQPVEKRVSVQVISSSSDEMFSLGINTGEGLRIQVKADSRVVNTDRLQPTEFGDCAKFVKPVAEDFIVKTEFIDEADANDKEAVSTFRTSCPCCNEEYKYFRSFLNAQVNCARCSELFIARETKFNPQSHRNWVSRNHNKNSSTFKAEHSTTDEMHGAEDQGPSSDVGMQRTNKGNKKIQTLTPLKERRYSAQSKRSSPKYPPTGKEATREERKRFTSNQIFRVSSGIGVERVDVPSADFHDFDLDRSESHIKAGQAWAVYDDQDGMPRYYARIVKVWYSPFRVNLVWLDPTAAMEKTRLSLGLSGLIVSCGDFKTGKASVAYEVNMFSHVVLDQFKKTPVKILPRKGEVWAIYRDLDLGAMAIYRDVDLGAMAHFKHSYSMVELLTDFSEEKGCITVSLNKVGGFRALFRRDPDHIWQQFLPTDLPKFSHYVISKKMCEDDTLGIPAGALELDPAATPPDLIENGLSPRGLVF